MVPHLIIMFKLILMCLLMERRSTKPNSDAWQRPVHLCLGHSFLVEDGLVGTNKYGLGQSEISVASPLACQLMMEKWISLAREHSEAFSAFLGEHFQRTQDSYFLLMSALLVNEADSPKVKCSWKTRNLRCALLSILILDNFEVSHPGMGGWTSLQSLSRC